MFLHAAYVPIKFVTTVGCCESAGLIKVDLWPCSGRFGGLCRNGLLLNYYQGKM